MTSNWIETFNRLNPVAQEQYKRYSEYRDKNMWSEVPTGQGGDSSDIDTKQWKADSGSKAFYLSPANYNQYDEWYKQEQAWKKEQQQQPAKTADYTPQAAVPPSVFAPQSAVPSNVTNAPLMSVSGADINTQVNSLLAQLAGLLSSSNNQQNPK